MCKITIFLEQGTDPGASSWNHLTHKVLVQSYGKISITKENWVTISFAPWKKSLKKARLLPLFTLTYKVAEVTVVSDPSLNVILLSLDTAKQGMMVLLGVVRSVTIIMSLCYDVVKSVQSTMSYLMSTSVPRATFTRFLVEHGLFQYYS